MFIGLLHPPWFHGILKSFWSELNRTPSDSQTSFVLVFETYIPIVAGLYANLWGSRTMVCNFNCTPKWLIYIRLVPFQSGLTCPADGQKEKRKSLSHWRHRCHWAPTTSFSPPGKGGVVGCCQAPHLCFLQFFVFEPANYQGPTTQMVLARVVSQSLRHVEKLRRQSAGMKNVGVFENMVFMFIPKKTSYSSHRKCSMFIFLVPLFTG